MTLVCLQFRVLTRLMMLVSALLVAQVLMFCGPLSRPQLCRLGVMIWNFVLVSVCTGLSTFPQNLGNLRRYIIRLLLLGLLRV